MIITDGKKIGKIGYVNEKYNTLPFKNITTNDIDEIVKALIFSKSKKLNSQNITTDFGLRPHSITMKLTNKLFHSLYNQELDTKTLMLFKEWQVLFHLSETDMGKNQDIIKRRSELSNLFEVNINDARSEYLALFSLQTTYAIIIKLIACKLLNKRLTNSENIKYFNDLTVVTSDELKEFLEKIEDGYSFSDNGIYNLLEGDFFSWYHLDSHWDYELYTLFNNLISKIEEYTTFEIPVYLGDSAIIPTTEKIENTECYVNTIETIEGNLNAIFPVDFVESSEFTPTLITAQKLLNIGILDEVISYLLEKISKYTAINVTLENKIQDLCNKIAELSSKQWDGIWLRIISNFLKAGSLKDLNIVVGNPPWVKWEYLPQNYAEKIKSVSLERHLFSGQTYMGAISLNICALIAHVNASYRLNEDGILAFLMPKTMMTQDSYEGFRNFILDIETNKRFYLQYAEDWEKSGHPFITMKDAFLSYYFKKDYIDYTKGVPLLM
ncbi:Eco57I restriction-modification methylase domain-containing protein [Staphylococcus devriesei]|uniref:Eco57I restriction-modification methylase domain-containing protein n=1 Tax=Staphylococcus devriesei TaxID=586733 RepID=UPI0026764FDD|nr:hypothetical protein [Staphylococcus devriesei]WKU12503.1 hypothetical protein Q2T90_06860 [Staphylococcus devriesei]